MLYVARPSYLEKLRQFREKDLIKVLMGPRRSGKSVLLELFQNELRKEGVDDEHLIAFNLEDFGCSDLQDPKILHQAVLSRVRDNSQYFVFIDEIQWCKGFERVVDSLYLRKNLDIYITGSNAFLLSGELATLLTGRYLPIEVLPFSFSEFRVAVQDDEKTTDEDFRRYLDIGSFPLAVQARANSQLVAAFYDMLRDSMLIKDVASRLQIRDTFLLTRITAMLASIAGSSVSARKIADTLSSNKVAASPTTISAYLKALSDSYFFFRVPRYDMVGRKMLTSLEKLYLCDPGFHRHLVSGRDRALGRLIENVVYLELRRRYAKVCTGRIGDREIDFIAQTDNDVAYYQVAATVMDEGIFDREVSAFEKVRDPYPQYLLTLDRFGTNETVRGIKVLNLVDWLLDKQH